MLTARSRMPHGYAFPNIISNSASLNGGAILFIDLDTGPVPHHLAALLQSLYPSDIHTDGSIELAPGLVVVSGLPNITPTFS